jgi:hypothetical protein
MIKTGQFLPCHGRDPGGVLRMLACVAAAMGLAAGLGLGAAAMVRMLMV